MEQKLGRGLSALLGDNDDHTVSVDSTQNNENSNMLDIDLIVPNEEQPRKFFDEAKIKELCGSISLHGILQPIAVRKKGNVYEIIAGERRWRAAKMAGLKRIPVHILEASNNEVMAFALIENIQRSDLNPIEEAEAIKVLITGCECTQDDVGIMLCKSRSYIGNSLRLLALPERVRELIRAGRLSAGHGKCLLGVQNADEIAGLAAQEGWNVRQLESAMKDLKTGVTEKISVNQITGREVITKAGTPIDMSQDHESVDIAIRVAEAIKVETKLKITKKGGVFTLICKSCEELENLIEKLISLSDTGR